LRDFFESCDRAFGDLIGGFLVIWIAVKNPASQRPRVTGGATAALILPGAGIATIEVAARVGRTSHKIANLERRYEQGMPEFSKPAAPTTYFADWSQSGYFPIDVVVNGS
jgi:hypothetical protein